MKDIRLGNTGSYPEYLTADGAGGVYFVADDGISGSELWHSDGTAGGTRMLQDLNAGPANSNPRGIVKAGDRIYLSAYKPGAGVELWSAQARRYIYLPLTRR